MQTNFLEELAAEWLEYKGYLVKRNERVGPLRRGELDVVAFNPQTKRLIHVEAAESGGSWDHEEDKFARKFALGEKYIGSLFEGLRLPEKIEKKAILGFGSDKNHKTVGGGEVLPAIDFILKILRELKGKPFGSKAVPEKYPILRVLQMIAGHRERKKVTEELNRKVISEAEPPI